MREVKSSASRETPVGVWRSKRLVLLTSLLLIGLVVLWYARQRPGRLLTEAKELAASNPVAAAQLLEDAIAAAGGQYHEAQFLRCQMLAAQGQWKEAQEGFSEIQNPSQIPVKDLVELAGFAMSQGALLLAELTLNAARRPGPELPQVLRLSIRLHLEGGLENRVLQECQELLQLVPEDAIAWQVQGAVHLDRKRLPEAEAAFREALKRTAAVDQQSSMREQLIRVLLDGGQVELAGAELDLLRRAGPLSHEARLMDAYRDRLEGRWERAHESVDWLLANAPSKQLQARLLRGMLWLDQGEPEKATPDLERVVTQQPYNKEAHSKLAQAYRKLNQPDRAQVHAEAAQRLTVQYQELLDLEAQLTQDSNNVSLRKRVADMYTVLGQPEKARKVLPP